MKKTILMCTILSIGTITAANASAIEFPDEYKSNSVVLGTIATGAFAGGPLGAMAGLVAGLWLGEKIEDADKLESVEVQLTEANNRASDLSQQLKQSETIAQGYDQAALDRLQLELLFKTGDNQLTASGQERITYVANLLAKRTELNIRLDGYSDPRGNSDYNQALSKQRVEAVVNLLIASGIESSRIKSYSHGDSQSSATTGDYDSYALERVVKIELSKSDTNDSFAKTSMP
jgi:outer membrane protein OmpA-like peptidoglycan-associated protein